MTIVLHHTLPSPFAELGRLALGFKDLDYRAVEIPNVLPKPELTALTGGYARTPVLQIGADIYCDTAAVFDALETRQPEPSFYPASLGALHRVVASWAGTGQFLSHVGVVFGGLPSGAVPDAFLNDRTARFGFDFRGFTASLPHHSAQVLTAACWLEAALADGRRFLGGDAAGHGDLAIYVNLWFVRGRVGSSGAAQAIAALPHLGEWYDRVAAIGHGRAIETSGIDAIAIAASATPDLREDVDPSSGFTAGQTVSVRTADTSTDDPVVGRLLRLSPRGIAIARKAPDGTSVAVNFPRAGQLISAG